MKAESNRWTVITPTPHDHEQLGLDLLRESLPDQSPYRGWANFEFIAASGQVYEVDCLVLTPKGFFLVELKHYEGTLEGSGVNRWYRSVGKRQWEEDNPLVLTNRKAKFLQSAMRKHVGRDVRLPFITPLTFLTNAIQDVRLRHSAAAGVVGPKDASWVGKNKLPDIGTALTSTGPQPDGSTPRVYSPEQLATGAKAFEKLGIKPSVGRRTIRDYVLGKTLEHGDIYQDFIAEHRRYPERKRRVRLYPHATSASGEERAAGARAAEREFTLFATASHPGIDSPQEFEDHDLGPALLFSFDPDAVRLDRWLRAHQDELTIEQRLSVVRDVAEALAHAHDDRIFHRALDPHAVYVSGEPGASSIRIRNWHAGVRAELQDGLTRLPTTGPSSLASAISSDADVVDRYRAPELRQTASARPRPADVFSLGAVAYLVLAGREPAANAAELDDALLANDGLAIDAAIDGVTEAMRMLVWEATQKLPTDRHKTVADFLASLDEVERESRVEDRSADLVEADPLEARKGDILSDRFEVLGRLGKGATAVALLVADEEANGAERVLKVALAEEHESRLREEGAALARLPHRRIVRLIGDPLVIGGRQALLMARAGTQTLAQRLAQDGPPDLELLERWGSDLLEAVDHLEEMGIAHRDLKPSNIGVAKQGKNSALHLVLFDFSLTKAPDHDIKVGTTGFVDPFLRLDGRHRWDTHAERFAAAVVLFQMATNELPIWGEPGVDPLMVEDEVSIDPTRFDPTLASAFTAFFEKSLARDVERRFGSAAEMLDGWRRCFEQESNSSSTSGDEPRERITGETPLTTLPLSTKARSTFDRVGVHTVSELLQLNPMSLNRMRGVGKKTVGEIRDLIDRLREEVDLDTVVVKFSPTVGLMSAERLLASLLAVAETDAQHRIVEAHLGLNPDASNPMPNQTEVAALTGTNQGTVSRSLADLRTAWDELPELLAARDVLVELLSQRNGVATLSQLARDYLSRCGSTASEPERTANGRAVVHAALEIETDRLDARWVLRRRGDSLLVALDRTSEANADADLADAAELLGWAAQLGERADVLAEQEPPLTPDRVVIELREVKAPTGLGGVADAQLVSLAASASERAEVSSRGELYVQGLDAATAIRRSTGSLLGLRELTPGQLGDRITARFPASSPLPSPEEISATLDALGLGFAWDPASGRWRTPEGSIALASTSHSASSTAVASVDDAEDFAERLAHAHDSGRLLVFAASIRRGRYRRALDALSRSDVTVIDVERDVLRALRDNADEYDVDWGVVLDADAAPVGSTDSANLRTLVNQTVAKFERQILGVAGTVLLHNLGLLARYDHLSLVERLRTAVQFGSQPLRSVWVLTATESSVAVPVVDGHPIGVLSPSEFAHIPPTWLDTRGNAA